MAGTTVDTMAVGLVAAKVELWDEKMVVLMVAEMVDA